MKTKNNVTRIAAQYAISASLFLTGFSTIQAALNADSGISAAAERLENLNLNIEESLKYEAPAVKEEAFDVEYFDAVERLEVLTTEAEKKIRFEAPAVDVEAEVEQYETGLAVERLDDISAAIEETVKFRAPSVDPAAEANEVEVAAATERLEALNLAVENTIRFNPAAFAAIESNEISGEYYYSESAPEISCYSNTCSL